MKTGTIIGILLMLILLYSCAVTGYAAMDAEVSKFDIARKERVYPGLHQYERFVADQERVERSSK